MEYDPATRETNVVGPNVCCMTGIEEGTDNELMDACQIENVYRWEDWETEGARCSYLPVATNPDGGDNFER